MGYFHYSFSLVRLANLRRTHFCDFESALEFHAKRKPKTLKNEDDEKSWDFQFDTSRAFWKMAVLPDQLCRKNWSNKLLSRKGKFREGRLKTDQGTGTVFCLLYQAGDEYKYLTFSKRKVEESSKSSNYYHDYFFFSFSLFVLFCFFFEVLNELRFRLSTSPRWFSRQILPPNN